MNDTNKVEGGEKTASSCVIYKLLSLLINTIILMKKEPKGSKKYIGSIQEGTRWETKNLPAQADN